MANSPRYSNPPVVEVALSVQFNSPPTFEDAFLGGYFMTQRQRFPKVRALAPIQTPLEDFGGQGHWLPAAVRFGLQDKPVQRLQMESEDGVWLQQIQRNRVVTNWRYRKDEAYPNFEAAFTRFRGLWEDWQNFLASNFSSCSEAEMWEVTYVNRIPAGDLWTTPADWPEILPGLWGTRLGGIEPLQLVGLTGSWVWKRTEAPQANLYIEPQPAKAAGGDELLMLHLTTRGPIRIGEGDHAWPDIERGLRQGHDIIIQAFESITSEKAKGHWR